MHIAMSARIYERTSKFLRANSETAIICKVYVRTVFFCFFFQGQKRMGSLPREQLTSKTNKERQNHTYRTYNMCSYLIFSSLVTPRHIIRYSGMAYYGNIMTAPCQSPVSLFTAQYILLSTSIVTKLPVLL